MRHAHSDTCANCGMSFRTQALQRNTSQRLGQPIATATDAATVADLLLPLVIESVNHQKGRAPKSVFISYSRADVTWLRDVTAILQPLNPASSTCGPTSTLSELSQWDATLRQKMARCDIAILLVSMPFLQSEYVRTVELPFLLERARAGLYASVVDICVAESVAEHGTARYSGGFASKGVAGGNQPRGYPVALVTVRQRIEQYVRASDGLANTKLAADVGWGTLSRRG